ncbi:pol-like protein [Colletotrichum kahawae]|uniref:Pol-like protein n=1 Tax=Colletotrichum kahawae TaxID=34407 RepID=A0AAD9YEE7_COLKA|nr:pol-like protein [Colletotrichum kahawae]
MMMSSINRAKGKEKARARHQRNSSLSKDLPQLGRDIRKCFNYNQISHITIWCPKPKRAYPAKVKKAKKREELKRAREKSNSTAKSGVRGKA